MAEILRRDPAITCQWDVPMPEAGETDVAPLDSPFFTSCGAVSQFVVERSDGDGSFGWDGKHESCEVHLAEVVAGMADGDNQVRAIVAIRWLDGEPPVHYCWPAACGDLSSADLWTGNSDRVTCPACLAVTAGKD